MDIKATSEEAWAKRPPQEELCKRQEGNWTENSRAIQDACKPEKQVFSDVTHVRKELAQNHHHLHHTVIII